MPRISLCLPPNSASFARSRSCTAAARRHRCRMGLPPPPAPLRRCRGRRPHPSVTHHGHVRELHRARGKLGPSSVLRLAGASSRARLGPRGTSFWQARSRLGASLDRVGSRPTLLRTTLDKGSSQWPTTLISGHRSTLTFFFPYVPTYGAGFHYQRITEQRSYRIQKQK
jgi:hypothetical protein